MNKTWDYELQSSLYWFVKCKYTLALVSKNRFVLLLRTELRTFSSCKKSLLQIMFKNRFMKTSDRVFQQSVDFRRTLHVRFKPIPYYWFKSKMKTKQLTYMMVSAVAVVSFSAYLSSFSALKWRNCPGLKKNDQLGKGKNYVYQNS